MPDLQPYYQNDLVTLYKGDCLEILPQLQQTFDCCITDPPYGTIKGVILVGFSREDTIWDKKLDCKMLFPILSKIIRQNGKIILFSQEPYTSELILCNDNKIKFCQKAVFIKSSHANPLMSKKAMVNRFEDICVFQKVYDKNNLVLRNYVEKIKQYIGLTSNKIIKAVGDRKAVHFFYYDDPQFNICSDKTYQRIIDLFHIDKMKDFLTYDELKKIDEKYKSIFNLGKQKSKSNIFEYGRDKNNVHPTQKPILLIEDLVKTYSNPNDLVLDFTAGSGTTGVAAMNTKRRCVLIEQEEKYCDITVQRLKDTEKQIAERLF